MYLLRLLDVSSLQPVLSPFRSVLADTVWSCASQELICSQLFEKVG